MTDEWKWYTKIYRQFLRETDVPILSGSVFFTPVFGIFPSLPAHVHSECSVSGCSLLDFQAVREGSTKPCLSCQQGTLAGYGRQLLASSLDGCWIGVRSSSLTCLK